MEDEEDSKGLVIFGKDISKIPCYRNSFLWGIGGGFAGGLSCFMFTSNIPKSNNWAMGTFMMTTLVYWVKCRYEYFEAKHELAKIQTALERKAVYEGTLIQKEVEQNESFDFKTV